MTSVDWEKLGSEVEERPSYYVKPGVYPMTFVSSTVPPFSSPEKPCIDLKFKCDKPNAYVSDLLYFSEKALPIAASKLQALGVNLKDLPALEDTERDLETITGIVEEAALDKNFSVKCDDNDYNFDPANPKTKIKYFNKIDTETSTL